MFVENLHVYPPPVIPPPPSPGPVPAPAMGPPAALRLKSPPLPMYECVPVRYVPPPKHLQHRMSKIMSKMPTIIYWTSDQASRHNLYQGRIRTVTITPRTIETTATTPVTTAVIAAAMVEIMIPC
ncbi:hypothetical protein OE88DRAFT_1661998 [Heliocybe sulcata]|uniref:Uncharacterized protein n=1 Tax=Heliocybe sulcata TaxID=5364 RepID=A0A5C3MWG2_9AGAM|nr:hypothetical protein OE88DRAFT_1661998 [Heliocybe sulcata]